MSDDELTPEQQLEMAMEFNPLIGPSNDVRCRMEATTALSGQPSEKELAEMELISQQWCAIINKCSARWAEQLVGSVSAVNTTRSLIGSPAETRLSMIPAAVTNSGVTAATGDVFGLGSAIVVGGPGVVCDARKDDGPSARHLRQRRQLQAGLRARPVPVVFDDRDCSDFYSQAEAQQHHDAGLGERDFLDGDFDGRACELLP